METVSPQNRGALTVRNFLGDEHKNHEKDLFFCINTQELMHASDSKSLRAGSSSVLSSLFQKVSEDRG